ncbi:MAG TPA: thiamine-phosphate kinase [Gammaproteobacteria bacterium]|nr:thiamine-phosphate kinase [Gammaproteobacteria bacterium]
MPLGEFDLIHRYFERPIEQRQDVIVGIGDDGAVVRVPPGVELVLTSDTLVAGVHFSEDIPPEDLGYKALAVNLSDLAAMGARPAWATMALTLPQAEEAWLAAFAQGFFELAQRFSVALIGGDLTRGPLSITVQTHGFVPEGRALRRNGAQAGHYIYVTGTLGDAALALTPRLAELTDTYRPYLLGRLYRPSPRVSEGLILRAIASSAIDISDGLIADLGHILEASHVGAVLEVDRLPLSTALQKIRDKKYGWELALTGGDDYELCFTLPPEHQAVLESKRSDFACTVSCIGRIEAERGLRCIEHDGTPYIPQGAGYRHF